MNARFFRDVGEADFGNLDGSGNQGRRNRHGSDGGTGAAEPNLPRPESAQTETGRRQHSDTDDTWQGKMVHGHSLDNISRLSWRASGRKPDVCLAGVITSG